MKGRKMGLYKEIAIEEKIKKRGVRKNKKGNYVQLTFGVSKIINEERSKEMKRLVEFTPKDIPLTIVPIDEVEDQELTIGAVTFTEGDYGPYALMSVETASGEKLIVSTGAEMIMKCLDEAFKQDAFPLAARFRRKRRRWVVE